jgi:hypothetical protein
MPILYGLISFAISEYIISRMEERKNRNALYELVKQERERQRRDRKKKD